MTTLSLKIPDELAKRLDALAEKQHRTRSELIREAIAARIDAEATSTTPSLLEQASDLCGSGKSGMGDLASNPDHLSGFGS